MEEGEEEFVLSIQDVLPYHLTLSHILMNLRFSDVGHRNSIMHCLLESAALQAEDLLIISFVNLNELLSFHTYNFYQ